MWPKSSKRFAMASFTFLPGCVSVWVASNIHNIVATICGAHVFEMCVCACVCSLVCDSCIMRVFVAVAKGKRKWRKNVSRFNGRSCGFNAISHNKWPSWRNISDAITSIIIIIIIIVGVIIIVMLLSRCSATRHVQHAYAMFSDADPPWLYITFNYSPPLSVSPSLTLFLFHHVAQWTDKCNYVAVLCALSVCVCVREWVGLPRST